MTQYKGASRHAEINTQRRRRDTRSAGRKFRDKFESGDGVVFGLFLLPIMAMVLIKVPMSGELVLVLAWLYKRRFIDVAGRGFDFPFRVPIQAGVGDGSIKRQKHPRTGKLEWKKGTGITYLAQDLETREQVYSSDSDLRTHMLVLGTTGSGKTEFLLGLVFNALVQNTGFIYVDGKGDPKLQKEVFRLARHLGREDDLLIINFITSGRDFVDKQVDKVTNNMNLMSNTSSGMLIEMIVSLMDDAGGGGDMWKGRAISFVASLTRPLIYLRDKGYLTLSPDKYLEYFELNVIEELVWEHNGRYGDMFDVIVAPLRSYLVTLPGYQKNKIKNQEQKTLEQHGFIIMQLTRIFNDLTFNYGHIFKSRVGDVDFFDVVINRRCLVVLLPALERAPDSLRMLGKMIVGSIKQMMAGCLGNRVEGVVREIIDSRPTNASAPFYTILDEYGYYAVLGFAVAPAQARSLGFAVIFAAQDFSSLKKSSPEEADATWENTNVRAVGRLTSGEESETWRRIQGAAGQSSQAMVAGFDRKMGSVQEKFTMQDNIQVERGSRLDYDDLSAQENGEFTLLIGKKEQGGKSGGVRVIRGMGFYTAGKTPKEMRINDFIPVEPPEPSELPRNRQAVDALAKAFAAGTFAEAVNRCIKTDATLLRLHQVHEANYAGGGNGKLSRADASLAALGWFLGGGPVPGCDVAAPAAAVVPTAAPAPAPALAPSPAPALAKASAVSVLSALARDINAAPARPSPYPAPASAPVPVPAPAAVDLIRTAQEDATAFIDKTLPALRTSMAMLDDVAGGGDDQTLYRQLAVAPVEQLLDTEMLARGAPFTTLDEKFDAEERAAALQAAIGRQTRYPVGAAPANVQLPELKQGLAALAQRCRPANQSSGDSRAV